MSIHTEYYSVINVKFCNYSKVSVNGEQSAVIFKNLYLEFHLSL